MLRGGGPHRPPPAPHCPGAPPFPDGPDGPAPRDHGTSDPGTDAFTLGAFAFVNAFAFAFIGGSVRGPGPGNDPPPHGRPGRRHAPDGRAPHPVGRPDPGTTGPVSEPPGHGSEFGHHEPVAHVGGVEREQPGVPGVPAAARQVVREPGQPGAMTSSPVWANREIPARTRGSR